MTYYREEVTNLQEALERIIDAAEWELDGIEEIEDEFPSEAKTLKQALGMTDELRRAVCTYENNIDS